MIEVARWLGLAMFGLGALTPLTVSTPDILASGNGKLVAIKNQDGLYRFNSNRAAKITAETWLRRNAQNVRLPFPDVTTAEGDSCNLDMCRFATSMGYVTVALTEAGAASACWSGRLVISLEPIEAACPSAERVIDFFDLWRHGTHAIWIAGDGSYRIERAFDTGDRPWTLRRFPADARKDEDGEEGSGVNTGASARSDAPES